MSKILGASKITVRFQVTIPKEAREKLQLSIGETLAFIEEDDRIYITTKV